MPRIRPITFYKARVIDPWLPLLLPVCRDLASSRNEFRWLEDHARHVSKKLNRLAHRTLLNQLILRRGHGEPLQYITQSEFFGDLEIICRDGVLIPRQETAASVSHLARRLRQQASESGSFKSLNKMSILDLCTGTGCIPLLFHYDFYEGNLMNDIALELVGVDISTRALSLARENLIAQIATQARTYSGNSKRMKSLQRIGFVHADVLVDEAKSNKLALTQALRRLNIGCGEPEFDVLIANPPYISPRSFQYTTSPSVRRFEPKLALVPLRSSSGSNVDTGDYFYPHLFRIANQINARVAMFEVADMDQARRVAQMAIEQGIWEVVEIWRDEPNTASRQPEHLELASRRVNVVGVGHGRSVFMSRSAVPKPQ